MMQGKRRQILIAIVLLLPIAAATPGQLTDPARPRYHFLPERNWMNDPNGLIQFKGEYHLFYQYNPFGAVWGNMSWGHARSKDLVHWERLPVALSPDMPYDRSGVFSGVMVKNGDEAVALYTGVSGPAYQTEVQCAAKTRDMEKFEKYAGNPVILPPPDLDLIGFRDPFVFRYNGDWMMAAGAGVRGKGGALLLYRSADLLHWEYLGPALRGTPAEGRMWECPNLFPLGGKWVFIYSPMTGRSNYMVGSFDGRTFTPELRGDLDLGGSLYAPQVFIDDSGRRIMFGWLKENRLFAERHGWQGVMTLPRVLTLGYDGDLRFAPAAEVESLRQENLSSNLPVSGDLLEVHAVFDSGPTGESGLIIKHGAFERTIISFDRSQSILRVNRSLSSLSPFSIRSTREAPLHLPPSEPLDLHVFLDRSVIEIYANNRLCLSVRVYPAQSGENSLEFFSRGAPLFPRTFNIWRLESVW